jgi:hypothetical protein
LLGFQHNGLVSFFLRTLWAVLFFGLVSFALPFSGKTKPSPPVSADRDYVLALAAANRFLDAWEAQDSEKGVILLSETAKHQVSEESLQTFFAPGPVTRAYEIREGKKLKDGRYSFSVNLFEIAAGHDHKWTQSRFSHLFVINAGKDDWVIDKLP